MAIPKPREVEAGGLREPPVGHSGGPKLVDANDVDACGDRDDQVPRACFEYEAERLDLDGRSTYDRQLDRAARTDARRDAPKLPVRNAIAGRWIGIVDEPRREQVGFLGELTAGRAATVLE